MLTSPKEVKSNSSGVEVFSNSLVLFGGEGVNFHGHGQI